MTGDLSFSYSRATFPFHSGCYTWPQAAVVTEDMESVILNVHCLRNTNRREFALVGFVGIDREEQISQAIFLAEQIGAEVIMFKGVGLTDEERPGQKLSTLRPGWPTRLQLRVLREALDMSRHGDFHETSLAYRLHSPVEEIRQHLALLADLGLMEKAE
jgi:hypothetical protein